MSHSLMAKFIYKFSDMLRSRIRYARYCYSLKNQITNPFKQQPHPVTLGPEKISHFFTYVANNERYRV